MIDFLSIRKVIIFSAIATDDRHPLRSRSLHQNTANCITIHLRYIAQPGGGGVQKTYCARSRNDVLPLTSRSNGMPSKKTMESLEDVCRCKTVLWHGRMFQGSDKVYNPLLYHAEQRNLERPTVLYSAVDIESFFSTTMESLPLKELNFGLQKPT